MKYLLLLIPVIALAGCSTDIKERSSREDDIQIQFIGKGDYSDDIYKFKDGDVTCYYYNGSRKGGISCLRDATSSASKGE